MCVHSNSSAYPLTLPSCDVQGLVIHNNGYVLIESGTHVRFGFLWIYQGGVLQVRGTNITLECTQAGGELLVGRTGTLSMIGECTGTHSHVALRTTHHRGCTELRAPRGTNWAAGDRVILTTCTSAYRDIENPIGGVPAWFDYTSGEQRAANARATDEWSAMSRGRGMEVATIRDVGPGGELTLCRPLYFDHEEPCHAGILSRPIRVVGTCAPGHDSAPLCHYPGNDGELPDKTHGHWAYGQGGVDGLSMTIDGALYLQHTELYRMGSTRGHPVHVGPEGRALVDRCSIWNSFSRFLTTAGHTTFTNNVCFWSMMSGLHVEAGSRASIRHNMITGVHNSMPGTFWNDAPHEIIPHGPLDLYMTASVWIDEPSAECTGNILCCSPSPVIGIWSSIRWVRDNLCEGTCSKVRPSRSYADNTCYNMEGFWSGIPDGKLVVPVHATRARLPAGYVRRQYVANPSGVRELRWMAGAHTYNLGPMDWVSVSVRDPRADRLFFELCPGTSTHAVQCTQANTELAARLDRLRAHWDADVRMGDAIRVDLEAEVATLREYIDAFRRRCEDMQTRLNAKMFTGQFKGTVGIGRGMFFKPLEDTIGAC